ncbi:hypothetical protein Tco_0475545, partial [Tanacetum coccineum]
VWLIVTELLNLEFRKKSRLNLANLLQEMDDSNITMKEYVQYETEEALINGKLYNWETATYGKIRYVEDINDLRFFEIKFSAIVYEDALTSELEFSSKPTVSPQYVDEVNLKNETSLSKYDDKEYNVISYNDLFPSNIFYVNDSKLDTDNDDDIIDIKKSSNDISIEPLHNVITINVDDPNMSALEDIVYSDDDEDVGAEANMNNLDAFMPVQYYSNY